MKNMKSNVLKLRSVLAIALTAVMVITAASCSKSGGGGGGKSLNSAEDLKVYLDKQPANGPDKPIKIAMKLNEPMFPKVRDVINEAGKYVSLDLTGSPTTTIPDSAFSKCKLLAGIIIPKGVISIGSSAFYNCTSLTSVTIPDSVTSIGIGAFNETAWFNNQQDGLVYVWKVAYKYKGNMPANTSITILDGTKGIAGNAFENCTNLASVTIPNSVTNIGPGAFYSCTRLASVTIPDSVTSIGSGAFAYCVSLTSVTFQGTIDANWDTFPGDLHDKYLKGGVGTYTTTAPVDYRNWNPGDYARWDPKWTKK